MVEKLIPEDNTRSLWKRHKSLLIGFGGLIIGCAFTFMVSYLFFSLGKSSHHHDNVVNTDVPKISALKSKGSDNISLEDYILFARQDSKTLVSLIQKVRNESQTELMLIKESRDEIMELLAEIRNKSDEGEKFVMKDCVDWMQRGYRMNGVYNIKPVGSPAFDVYCDMLKDGGGWLVFQRRINGSVDFFRDWASYENGFGDLQGEFWLGNKYLHTLTTEPTELRIDLRDWDDEERFAIYSTFSIGDADSKYTLYADGYSGNAGDSLALHHKVKFSTRDQDNDVKRIDCAGLNKGAWWYEHCSHACLNGEYTQGTDGKGTTGRNKGINWEKWKGDYYSLKAASMMLRRKM